MNEDATEQAVLKYLSSIKDDEYGPFLSLTTLFENVVGSSLPHVDAYDEEDEIESKETLRVLLDQMVFDGLLVSRWGERDYEANYRIADQGGYEASGFDQLASDLPSNALLSESGNPILTESGDPLVLEDVAEAEIIPKTTDSSAWTGLPSTFTLAEEKRESLVSLLREAEESLDQLGAGNSEKAMARAFIVAARVLADAPDPPVDLIWEIIGRANSLAGIASLLVSIIALFSVATH